MVVQIKSEVPKKNGQEPTAIVPVRSLFRSQPDP